MSAARQSKERNEKLLFSPGMTADELLDWNVEIGQITKAQAAAIREEEAANGRA